MRRAVLTVLDWFIPSSFFTERSKIGLARNFVITHLLGPFLIQSIVVAICQADPYPGWASYGMMMCVSAFWLLPFGFKITGNFSLMALISVQLLCVVSLIGTSFYGGVNSPFLPWLLVSLMLGFFYLSDQALSVVALFAFNIVAMIVVHLLHEFPQHLSRAELGTISWVSVFSATTYMSFMAIYYANIVMLSSELERETERHRLMAQRLREARRLADTANHGKSVFLGKMYREFQQPLSNILTSSRVLLDRLQNDPQTVSLQPELKRIDAAAAKLLDIVRDSMNAGLVVSDLGGETAEDVALDPLVDRVAATVLATAKAQGHEFVVDRGLELGQVFIDPKRLYQVVTALASQAASKVRDGKLRMLVRRLQQAEGDWIEIQIRVTGVPQSRRTPEKRSAVSTASDGDAGLEAIQMHCAMLGGQLDTSTDAHGVSFTIQIPAASPIQVEDALRAA